MRQLYLTLKRSKSNLAERRIDTSSAYRKENKDRNITSFAVNVLS